MATIVDLTGLPEPTVVETLTYDAIYNQLLADFIGFDPDYELLLESDPVVKVLQVVAYRELLLRTRINDAAQANILAFAEGADLDQLAAFYNVERLVIVEEDLNAVPPIAEQKETDAVFRVRIQEAIAGSSTAGPALHYSNKAKAASGQIKDIAVDSPASGEVRITVLSTEGDGVPDSELIDTVDAVVQADDVRVITDTVTVQAATKVNVDIEATIQLLPDTPQDTFTNLESNFTTAFNNYVGLGKDITLSWITKNLMPDGVYKVTITTPTDDVSLDDTQFANLNSINLTEGARAE